MYFSLSLLGALGVLTDFIILLFFREPRGSQYVTPQPFASAKAFIAVELRSSSRRCRPS